MPKAILAADAWAPLVYKEDRVEAIRTHGRPHLREIINKLLLYDSVALPCQDYLALAELIYRLGQGTIIDLVESKSLSFIRIPDSLIAATATLQKLDVARYVDDPIKPSGPPPVEQAVQYAVEWGAKWLEQPAEAQLTRRVCDATVQLQSNGDLQRVADQTLQSARQVPQIRAWVEGGTPFDVSSAQAAGPITYKGILAAEDDSVSGRLMRLVAANFELWLAAQAGVEDVATTDPVEGAIAAMAHTLHGQVGP